MIFNVVGPVSMYGEGSSGVRRRAEPARVRHRAPPQFDNESEQGGDDCEALPSANALVHNLVCAGSLHGGEA